MTDDAQVTKRGPGRPRILRVGGKRMTVTLDQACYERALELGEGKVNRGIRVALQTAPERPKPDADAGRI